SRRAEQAASRLRALELQPEALVGICLRRSWQMVAAILGTIKAGGAYVPMDPEYPRERLEFMLQDANARVLITQRELLSSLPAETAAHLICIEDLFGAAPAEEPAIAPESSHASSSSLAYVIYTSGSTGKPKGVAIEHRSAV